MATYNYNRKISIQQNLAFQNSLGELLPAWGDAFTCFACIDIQGSQLLYNTAEFMSKVTYRITIPWTRSTVFTQAMRIMYVDDLSQTHYYSIEAILNDNRQANETITFLCYELGGVA